MANICRLCTQLLPSCPSPTFFLLASAATAKLPTFQDVYNQLLHSETHLGPDGTMLRLKQNAQITLKSLFKHAGQ